MASDEGTARLALGGGWGTLRQEITPRSLRFPVVGTVRLSVLAPVCAAAALLATACFFVLHHVGNQLPYDLAAQRFLAESESDRPDEGYVKFGKSTYEYCEISGAVMAGARESSQGSALRNAVILKELRPTRLHQVGRCEALEAAAKGAAVPLGVLKTRYWWGGKALYAIALRYASVQQIREFTQVATRVAYLLLAVSLFALSPKMLLLAAPLVVFGAFFSGIDYWADVANGFPYLWTVLLAAGLALLMRIDVAGAAQGGAREGERRGEEEEQGNGWSGTVLVYCFVAGTVSSYLYMGDGHTFLAATWIGMVVWFGCGAMDVAARTAKALWSVALYGAGFVACYVLGQVVKMTFLGEGAWWTLSNGVAAFVVDSWLQKTPYSATPDPMAVSSYLDSFYTMAWPSWLPADVLPTSAAVFSLAASLGFAVFEARRGNRALLWGVLWIVGLISVSSATFLIVDHQHYRTARFVFVPLALCLSSLVLAVRTMSWRRSLATIWELPVLLVVVVPISWYLGRYELSATAKMIESVESLRPVVRSLFDVYLDEDRLVYVNENCRDWDDNAPAFLHLYPVDVADLPTFRQQYGFDNLDFTFQKSGRRDAQRCAAVISLPDYEVVTIHTGQYVPNKDYVWSEKFSLKAFELSATAKMLDSVENTQLVQGTAFDVYLDEDDEDQPALVYVKEECGDWEDAPFFLHVYPVDIAALPAHRQQHGFDNLDFSFQTNGQRAADGCAAVRVLPDYETALIHTGQYLPEGGRVWSKKIPIR